MPTTTARQGLPLPVSGDDPDVPTDMSNLAIALEALVNMRFTSTADRDSKIPSPSNGMVCVLLDDMHFQLYGDSQWRTFFTGATPGSGFGYGQLASYQTTPPTELLPGALAIDRLTSVLKTINNSGSLLTAGARAVAAHTVTRYGSGGLATTPGGSASTSCSMTVTTTAASTDLLITGMSVYTLKGIGSYLGVHLWQEVDVLLYVTPPGGVLTELRRWTQRDINSTVGGGTSAADTAHTCGVHDVYQAATAGAYLFTMRMGVANNGGNGNVNNFGGEMTVQPIKRTTTF